MDTLVSIGIRLGWRHRPHCWPAGTGRAAQLGVVITGPEVLESTRRIDTVVLDKTGTVTTGAMTMHAMTGPASRCAWSVPSKFAPEHPTGAA